MIAERDHRRPSGRVGVPQRDHGDRASGQGFLVGFGVALARAALEAPAEGWGDGRGRRPGPPSRIAWWTPSRDIQHERRRASASAPGMTYIAAQVVPVRRAAGQPVLGRCTCRPTLSSAMTRRVRLVEARRSRPARRADPDRPTIEYGGAGSERACPSGGLRRPSPRSCRRRTGPASPPSAANMSPSTYVEVIADDVARGRQPAGRLGREAAAVGGRRVGPDLLLRRVDDVQVVEAARPGSRRNVSMPMTSSPQRGRARTSTLVSVPLPRVVGRTPAPQDVLGVEDQQVLAADAEVARRWRPCRRSFFVPVLTTTVAFLRLEVDPVDGLGRRGR